MADVAGIGFELRKVYDQKGILSKVQAYGYTGAITAGPMLLGMLLLVGINWGAGRAGLGPEGRETVVCVITYCLLGAMFLSSFFSMVSTRFIADMMYENRYDAVLPSLAGVLCCLLPTGAVCAAAFLSISGLPLDQMIPSFILFLILLTVWTEMNYMTAVKSYQGILTGYVLAVGAAFLSAFLFCTFAGVSVTWMLYSCCIGYGVMMTADLVSLCDYFPDDGEQPFLFLKWFDLHPELVSVGVLMNVGLFSHLVIMWHSDISEPVMGLFVSAPQYDIAALFAFLTVLVTSITFVVSTEVRFYPVYRDFYDLLNGTGSIEEIKQAQTMMLSVLEKELSFISQLQFYVTLFMTAVGPVLLNILPLGFNDTMDGYFRMLCIGYGAYAVGNVLMLLLLYFADDRGAAVSAALFAAAATGGTLLSLYLPSRYYGIGFTFGSLVYLFFCWRRLNRYTKHLGFYVLSTQAIVPKAKKGLFSRLSERLDGGRKKSAGKQSV